MDVYYYIKLLHQEELEIGEECIGGSIPHRDKLAIHPHFLTVVCWIHFTTTVTLSSFSSQSLCSIGMVHDTELQSPAVAKNSWARSPSISASIQSRTGLSATMMVLPTWLATQFGPPCRRIRVV